tara:strand:- start:744 stop:1598 length:855 start_codon:yes stop_codon:yes gene_type:complete
MRDDQLRDLERIWLETREPGARKAWLHASARAGQPWRFGSHVTRTPAGYEVLEAAEGASEHARPLVIVGPAGSGRTSLARAIHEASHRAGGPFQTCDQLADSLFEAELFGYLKTGWVERGGQQPGATETAKGGTLLITRIDPLPPIVQSKLRRCLEEGVSRRVGEREERVIDARFVFEVPDPDFLGSLWTSLDAVAAVTLSLPSLTDRRADIPLILNGLDTEGLSLGSEVLELMGDHDWPGQVRELVMVVERAKAHLEHEIPISGLPPAAFETRALELLTGLRP